MERQDWIALGVALRNSALDAHDGNLPTLESAWAFLLDSPECFLGDDMEWPEDMPAEAPILAAAAYYGAVS